MVKKEVEKKIWNNVFELGKDLLDIVKEEAVKARGLENIELQQDNERHTRDNSVSNSSDSVEGAKVDTTEATPTGMPTVTTKKDNSKI
jgi:hypothetical protein